MMTAATGLYAKTGKPTGGANLFPPWEDGGRDRYSGEPIVILGAGSNVGLHGESDRQLTSSI